MTSPLPPRRRDSRNLADLIRQNRQNVRGLDPGMVGGRFPPAKPLRPVSSDPDDDTGDVDDPILFRNLDTLTTGAGNVAMHLTYTPEDGSEHVSWHPNGGGGLHLPASTWSRTDRLLTIPAFAGQGAGDLYTCEYAYYDQEPEPISPSVVGYTVPGVWDPTPNTVTFAIPAGTAAGDLLVLTIRGTVAPGGGDATTGYTCSDPRMTLAFASAALNGTTPLAESVFVGVADGSGTPIVVNVVPRSGYTAGGSGVLAAITGANGWGAFSVVDGATAGVTASTPTVAGVAAIAATWDRGLSFTVVNAGAPTGYTNIASTGSDYFSTDLSFWFDPDGTTSPAGTFTGEGCCVIAIV